MALDPSHPSFRLPGATVSDPRRRIANLPIGARRELLRVLTAPPNVRTDLIRQMHQRRDTRELAEVLIDLEADDFIRLQVITLLEEAP